MERRCFGFASFFFLQTCLLFCEDIRDLERWSLEAGCVIGLVLAFCTPLSS